MEAILKKRTEELATEIAANATTVDELNGLMRTLMKSALERMLDTELDIHLGRVPEEPLRERSSVSEEVATAPQTGRRGSNRRNGHSPKTIQGDMGKLPLDIPRDRNGTFEPQLIQKHQRRLSGLSQRSQEPRPARYLCYLHRWPQRLSRSHRGGLPRSESAAVHRALGSRSSEVRH